MKKAMLLVLLVIGSTHMQLGSSGVLPSDIGNRLHYGKQFTELLLQSFGFHTGKAHQAANLVTARAIAVPEMAEVPEPAVDAMPAMVAFDLNDVPAPPVPASFDIQHSDIGSRIQLAMDSGLKQAESEVRCAEAKRQIRKVRTLIHMKIEKLSMQRKCEAVKVLVTSKARAI